MKNSTFERVIAASGILVFGAGVYLVREFNPVTAGFFPQCPLYTITGFHCPGCGLTRGFHALLNGDFLTALHFNALIPFYLTFGLIVLASLFLTVFRGRGFSINFLKPWFLWSYLFISVAFGILRNIPSYPFNMLAP